MRKISTLLIVLFGMIANSFGQTELFFSEYIEGSSYNKALEIYNGTGTSVNLDDGNYVVQIFFNGKSVPNDTIYLSGTITSGDVFVFASSSAEQTILDQSDQTTALGMFNGNDAIVLKKGGTDGKIIDVIGQVGTDPGSEWGSDLTSTKDNTLRRKETIVTGDTIATDEFDPSEEWDGYAKNTFDDLGTYSAASQTAPVITNVTYSPNSVVATSTVTVSAEVTDNETIDTVFLAWGIASGNLSDTIAMTNTSGSMYATSVGIPAQEAGTTVYYSVSAIDNDGETTSTVESSYKVTGAINATLPYSQTFETDLGDMTQYSSVGDQIWEWADYGNDAGCAKISGYANSSSNENKDWLISPSFNLDSTKGEIMTFETVKNYSDTTDDLSLLYSNDYVYGSDPVNYTWVDISDRATFAKEDSWSDWTSSGYIDLSDISGVTYIAFKYTSTSSNSTTWEIDNVSIRENDSILITDIARTPLGVVLPDTSVAVSANILYNIAAVASADLIWGVSSGSYTDTIPMTKTSTYYVTTSNIPGQKTGSEVFFQIVVAAEDGVVGKSEELSYSVQEYYASAEGKSGEELKTALYNIINDHKEYTYSEVWDILKETDKDPDNSNNVIEIYTGNSVSNSGYPIWNREHVWAKSHGSLGTEPPAGTDAHHLRPSDVSVNAARGNLDFDEGGTLVDGTSDCYRKEGVSFEPRDEVKGDIARMMFYMAVRYEGDGDEPDLELVDTVETTGAKFGKLSTLLKWNDEDPVSDFEMNRNLVVYKYQGNRNPFVDHPEYADSIWGSESTTDIVYETASEYSLYAYPNPFSSTVSIHYSIPNDCSVVINVYNIQGVMVKTLVDEQEIAGEHSVKWNGESGSGNKVGTGLYFYRIITDTGVAKTARILYAK